MAGKEYVTSLPPEDDVLEIIDKLFNINEVIFCPLDRCKEAGEELTLFVLPMHLNDDHRLSMEDIAIIVEREEKNQSL